MWEQSAAGQAEKLSAQDINLLVRAKSFCRPRRLVLEDENADGGTDTRRLALIEGLVSNVFVTPPLQSKPPDCVYFPCQTKFLEPRKVATQG